MAAKSSAYLSRDSLEEIDELLDGVSWMMMEILIKN